MHLLNTIPQRLDPGATPTFAGLIAPTLTSPASTNLTLAGGSSGASLVLGQGADGAVTISPAGTGDINLTAAGSGSFVYVNAGNPILFINETDQASDARLWGMQSEGGLFRLRAFNDALSSAVDTFAATRTGNLLIGTTSETGLTGAGGLKINSTTAGSAGAGALVVTGGLSAGNNGNASYFGGAVTVNGTITSTAGNNAGLFLSTTATTGYQYFAVNSTGAALRIGIENSAGAALVAGSSPYDTFIGTANATGLTLSTNGTNRLRIDSTGAATFAGAVTVGGKIQSSVSTATGYNQLYDTSGITTGRGAFAITSTGAGLAFGVEASVGGTSFTGSTAYASYFGTTTATPIHFVTNSVIRQTIDSAGAATFAGAVTIGNTVNTVSPTSPNRTITMVVNGVTLYLAAKTTND
jgi:hypothetical protein